MKYSKIILSTHAFIDKKELSNAQIDRARRVFTIRSKYADGFSVPVYAEKENLFGFPMYYQDDFGEFTDELHDLRQEGKPAKFRMCQGFKLRDNQKPLIEQFLQSLARGKTGFLLNLATGGGKTVLACRMLKELGRTALVIVPREQLVNQWIERLLQHTSLNPDDIGIVQQDICDYEGKKVVIGMIQSLSKDKYPAAFKRYFGAVVWDECHVVGAQTFSKTIGLFPAKYRIGMSATMDRKDGMAEVYKLSIGQVLLAPPKLATLVQPKVFLRSYRARHRHPYLATIKSAKNRRGILISELAGDLARNALIAFYAKKFVSSGRRTVVFSDRIEQLKTLNEILVSRHKMLPSQIGLFTGSTKENDRQRILDTSPIILATYGVMAMGIDVPDLKALVFATPLSDVAQSAGRILRLCGGTKDPVILDVVDVAYTDCVRWSYHRQKYYTDIAKAQIFKVTE